jgi:hypothetical protein
MTATKSAEIARSAAEDSQTVTISTKEMLAKLSGVFPFDEAVLEGKKRNISPPRLISADLVYSTAEREHISVRGAFW